jgi:MFS family permease
LSIIPKASDPRLNTAKFVFQKEGQENEMLYIIVLSVAMVFSLCGGFSISFYWLNETAVKETDVNETGVGSCRTKAVKCTAFFLLLICCLSILIFGVVTFNDDVRPGNQVCLYILYGYQIFVFFLFVVSFFCLVKKKEKSTLYFYLFSFVACFHFVWVSLGVFSNPLWTLPILLTILTTIFLIFFGIYYIIVFRSNWDDLVRFFFPMFLTFFSYVTFTWISARFFFTNELVSALIQTLLTAVLGRMAVPIWKKGKKKKADQKNEEHPEQVALSPPGT